MKLDHTPAYKTRTSTTKLVVHCAQTNAKQDFGVDDIREWHVKENGWIDVGYHFVIRRNGDLQRGRPIWALGSHVAGHNDESIGICLVGGCDEQGNEQNNFTPEQWVTLELILCLLLKTYPGCEVLGHRDFPNVHKYCPSFDARRWWASVQKS